jgi:hypothetical protein
MSHCLRIVHDLLLDLVVEAESPDVIGKELVVRSVYLTSMKTMLIHQTALNLDIHFLEFLLGHVQAAPRIRPEVTSQLSTGEAMNGSQIILGKKYGWRLKPSVPGALCQVQVLEKIGRKGMIKIRHLGPPHEGLDEFVKTASIIVPWHEQKAFLRDEERLRQAREASATEGDRARQEATSTILESSGERIRAAVYRADGSSMFQSRWPSAWQIAPV